MPVTSTPILPKFAAASCAFPELIRKLKDGFDFGVEGYVRLGKSIDAISLGGGLGRGRLQRETEKAADVIILVKDSKNARDPAVRPSFKISLW